MDKLIAQMIQQAEKAAKHAYAPYSHFHVGCCLETEAGHFFSGCNVENASFSLTSCAETTAIGQMITAGHTKIRRLLVIGNNDTLCAPCGGCRQRISEFSSTDTEIIMCNQKHEYQKALLSNLLPHSFGPQNL